MNTLESVSILTPANKEEICAKFVVTDPTDPFVLFDVVVIDNEYTFSCWIKSEADGSFTVGDETIQTNTEWSRQVITFTAEAIDMGMVFNITGTYYIYHAQLELGNIASDWGLAPIDFEEAIKSAIDQATNAQITADGASQAATDARDRVFNAEIVLDSIRECISMLVRDENGESLMTQDGDGWTFSMESTNTALSAVSKGLDELQKDVGNAEHTVEILQQAVNDVSEISSYVKIKTDGDKPCIELGTGNSDFKLLITNTDIRFMEGSSVPAYINNQSLHISKAVIEEEMRQGDFIWKNRANGNMGLIWGGS